MWGDLLACGTGKSRIKLASDTAASRGSNTVLSVFQLSMQSRLPRHTPDSSSNVDTKKLHYGIEEKGPDEVSDWLRLDRP